MYPIFRYLDKRTRFVTILGALANGGVVLAQPLVLSQALSLDQGQLTYTKILHFAFYGFTVYFIFYSLMLFCNHTHNVFRREIHMSIRIMKQYLEQSMKRMKIREKTASLPFLVLLRGAKKKNKKYRLSRQIYCLFLKSLIK